METFSTTSFFKNYESIPNLSCRSLIRKLIILGYYWRLKYVHNSNNLYKVCCIKE